MLDPRDLAEMKRRRKNDPLYFARVVWGRQRWSAQRAMRIALATFSFVVIFSANGVGKTSELAAWIIEDVVCNPGTRFTLVGPKFDNVKDGLFAEIRDLYFAARKRGIDLGGDMQTEQWKLGERWDVACAAAETPSSFQGRRGRTRTKVVIDEAQGDIHPDHWDALESLLTGEGSQFVASGNPITTGGRFREIATDASKGWHRISISALDHPNYMQRRRVIPGPSYEDIERKRKAWGENDPRWISRVGGRFPSAAADQLISGEWIARWADALKRGEKREGIPELKGRRAGVDLARQGDDKCVLLVLEDGVVIHREEWEHARLTESGQRIRAAAIRFEIPHWNLKLDVTGTGAGAADELARVGMPPDEVNFGEGQAGDWPELTAEMEIKNRRCELHWIAARLIERGHVVIPEEYGQLRYELTQPRYKFPNSIFTVEPKDELKKRLGRSPDDSDALITALSNASNGGCGVTRVRFGG